MQPRCAEARQVGGGRGLWASSPPTQTISTHKTRMNPWPCSHPPPDSSNPKHSPDKNLLHLFQPVHLLHPAGRGTERGQASWGWGEQLEGTGCASPCPQPQAPAPPNPPGMWTPNVSHCCPTETSSRFQSCHAPLGPAPGKCGVQLLLRKTGGREKGLAWQTGERGKAGLEDRKERGRAGMEDRKERKGWHGRRGRGRAGRQICLCQHSHPSSSHYNQRADSCPRVTTWIEAFLYQLLPSSPHRPVTTDGMAPD